MLTVGIKTKRPLFYPRYLRHLRGLTVRMLSLGNMYFQVAR